MLLNGTDWPLNTAYNGDCLEFMKQLPDKSIDLVLTDPPYRDESENQPTRTMRNISKMESFGGKPNNQFFEELSRISKHQIIWGANNFEYNFKGFIVWNKKHIPNDFTLSKAEIASLSEGLATTSKMVELSCDRNNIHPTQKPLKLFKWCLEKYAPENAIVFDPFLGSFTTAVACHSHGLNWIGCEKDPDYFKAGQERYETECLQNLMDFDL